MSTIDNAPATDLGTTDAAATPSVDDAVMAVLGGFASICGAPDDPEVAAAANTALRDLDDLVARRPSSTGR